jgi:RNA polymerase sigma-70 factor (ECF subfamily)
MHMPPPTDLTEPAPDLRQQRIAAVVRDYQQPLLRYTSRLLRNATLAEDVVQTVFIKLCRNWSPRQEAGGDLKPWLFRVAHNEAVDLIRSEARRNRLHTCGAAEAEILHGGIHTDAVNDDDRHALVLGCLDALDPSERQVILLRLQQNMSYDEIAATVNRPRGTVGALLHTAVKKLARQVRRKEGA